MLKTTFRVPSSGNPRTQATCAAYTLVQLAIGSAMVAFLSVQSPQAATGLPAGFQDVLVVSGLSNPTAMEFAPDGRLFVTQQGGQLRVIKNGVLLSAPFLTLTVNSSGERGLLGIAFDPNFAVNQFIYVYYTATTPAVHNRISRFKANGDIADASAGELVLLDFDNLSGATNHNGGALHFGVDGKLYAAHGDNANGSNAQSLEQPARQDHPHEPGSRIRPRRSRPITRSLLRRLEKIGSSGRSDSAIRLRSAFNPGQG